MTGSVSVGGVRLGLAVLLLVMPCITIATLANPVLQGGMIDPYVYTGLLHRYLQVLDRYGSTYYANRVAFTVPARTAIWLLGDAAGHYVIETVLLFAATVSAFAVGRRYFSTPVGVMAAAWTSFNPWLIRSLAWDYVEGAAVCYLLVGLCCFAIGGRRAVLLHAAGGVALALAFNCDPFVAAIAIAFSPAWLILCRSQGLPRCVACAVTALAAFVAAYAALIVVEYLELPRLGFGREFTTFAVGMRLLHGGGAVWYRPFAAALAEGRIYILTPVFLAAGAILFIAGERLLRRDKVARFAAAGAIFLVLTCGIYWLFHDYFSTAVVTSFWYDAYAFPAALFAMTALLGSSTQALPRPASSVVCWLAGAGFAFLWVGYSLWRPLLLRATLNDCFLAAAVVTVAMAASWFPRVRALAAVAGACLAIAVFYFPGGDATPAASAVPEREGLATLWSPYAALHDKTLTPVEHDLYEGAVSLQNAVAESLPLSDGPVGFWYGETPTDAPFRSVQSVFLFGYSRIVSPALPDAPGVTLDAGLRRELGQYSHIAILSRTRTVGDAALQALAADGGAAVLRGRSVFPGLSFGFVVTMVGYVPPPAPIGALVTEIPRTLLAPQNGGSLATEGEAVTLRTSPVQWTYSATAPLPADTFPKEKLVLRVRLRVLRGQVGVIVASAVPSAIIGETTAMPTDTPMDIDVAIPDPATARFLILRNRSPLEASTVQILNISIFHAAL